MARAAASSKTVEEDFIDMDLTMSPPPSVEFEFKMADNNLKRPPLTSPADELFYNGKILPLCLPPRLQMVEKLLRSAVADQYRCWSERYENRSPDAAAGTAPSSAAATPFESCNASPCNSCYASGELNPDDYFDEGQSAQLIQSPPPPPPTTTTNPSLSSSPWSQKIKLIKKSSICSKLKASKVYIKSFFAKSNEVSKAKFSSSDTKHEKAKTKPPTSAMAVHEGEVRGEGSSKRRSFYRALKRQSTIKSCSTTCSSSPTSSSSSSSSSSSFFSSNSSSFSSVSSDELEGSQPMLKRSSSSASSDHESSIQGAIAYCKKSQLQQISARKSTTTTTTVSDVDSRQELRF